MRVNIASANATAVEGENKAIVTIANSAATAESGKAEALRFQRVLIVVLHVFLTQSVWLVDTIVAERLSIK